MGDAFFNDRSHQTSLMPFKILFPVIRDLIDPTTDQKVKEVESALGLPPPSSSFYRSSLI